MRRPLYERRLSARAKLSARPLRRPVCGRAMRLGQRVRARRLRNQLRLQGLSEQWDPRRRGSSLLAGGWPLRAARMRNHDLRSRHRLQRQHVRRCVHSSNGVPRRRSVHERRVRRAGSKPAAERPWQRRYWRPHLRYRRQPRLWRHAQRQRGRRAESFEPARATSRHRARMRLPNGLELEHSRLACSATRTDRHR